MLLPSSAWWCCGVGWAAGTGPVCEKSGSRSSQNLHMCFMYGNGVRIIQISVKLCMSIECSQPLWCLCGFVLGNRLFFDACDGIFLNYFWKESSLEQSRQLSSEQGRSHDVYVGVDVFGRGCCGNGGFNTVEVMMSSQVSQSALYWLQRLYRIDQSISWSDVMRQLS